MKERQRQRERQREREIEIQRCGEKFRKGRIGERDMMIKRRCY